MDTASLIGFLASTASITSFVPQAWKVIVTRDTSGLSAKMYAITVTGFALWLIYGILLGQWPIIVTNAVCLMLAGFILVMRVLPEGSKNRLADVVDPTK